MEGSKGPNLVDNELVVTDTNSALVLLQRIKLMKNFETWRHIILVGDGIPDIETYDVIYVFESQQAS